MPLPSSGQLSINQIRIELGYAEEDNASLGDFSDEAGFSAPDKISDFYGFSAPNNAYIIDNENNTHTSTCLLISSIGPQNFNVRLTQDDIARILNGTTGVEMDYPFDQSVDGNTDRFGFVGYLGGTLTRKTLVVDDDNRMTSVTSC